MRIAQRFNVGLNAPKRIKAPSEAAEILAANRSAAPAGLVNLFTGKPNVETLGYYQMSLRDQPVLQTLPKYEKQD